jgi:hypothetical protein
MTSPRENTKQTKIDETNEKEFFFRLFRLFSFVSYSLLGLYQTRSSITRCRVRRLRLRPSRVSRAEEGCAIQHFLLELFQVKIYHRCDV